MQTKKSANELHIVGAKTAAADYFLPLPQITTSNININVNVYQMHLLNWSELTSRSNSISLWMLKVSLSHAVQKRVLSQQGRQFIMAKSRRGLRECWARLVNKAVSKLSLFACLSKNNSKPKRPQTRGVLSCIGRNCTFT